MAELRNPNPGGGESSLVVLLVLMVCVFLGVQWFSKAGDMGAVSLLSHSVSVGKASGSAPVTMNLLERGLLVPLAVLHTYLSPRLAGSWGWAIVLLTGGINVLLLPMRIAGMRSGRQMMRLQPAIETIRARYKDVSLTDPRRSEMNAEIAVLQKKNGINPFGGCLPLLIQMPLLFAFFGMLRKAPALQGANWLWLHDLSVADPFHILPILMILTQLLVQWYTPSPGVDVKQQRLMACIMTVGFAYVSWHYAAGLALYALTGSLFSLGTQAVMNVRP